MFCKSCGRKIDNDSTFCSFCGTKQSTDLKTQVQLDINQSTKSPQQLNNSETNLNNSLTIVRQPKYEASYKKEYDAMVVGIILLVIAVIFAIVGPIKLGDRESYGPFRAVTAIVSIMLRIFVTVWVVKIAKRQNRETFGWRLFAFLLPSIALIVIATRKKIFANIQIVEGLDNDQNSKILSYKAQEFYNEYKYLESIRFSEKAIELNYENEIAKEVLKKSKVAFAEANNVVMSKKEESDNTPLYTRTVKLNDGRVLTIKSHFDSSLREGDKVFIENYPAPNGKYKYGWLDYISVKDGKII